MTEPFSWENWSQIYLNKKNKKRAALERYGLRNLHSIASLDFIVSKVHELYLNNMQGVCISAKSIWIDGTPQAKFTTDTGITLNCELADLLFIIHEVDNKNVPKTIRAVLLQGKCSEKHNLLPDGPSTEKERKLLESINRNEYLTLYPGTTVSGKEIGKYKLGGGISGLSDCAKYLMMPKNERWNYKTADDIAPYMIGWPQNSSSKKLVETKNYLDSVISGMLISKTMGKDIQLTAQTKIDRCCEWSKMIDDLLKGYSPITMKGYGCQRRVYESTENNDYVFEGPCLVHNRYLNNVNGITYVYPKESGGGNIRREILDSFTEFSRAIIPTILINIKHPEETILYSTSKI